MFALVVLSCLATSSCEAPERADVHAERWPTPIGCQAAALGSLADWQARNPGWRPVRVACIDERRVGRLIDEAIGHGARKKSRPRRRAARRLEWRCVRIDRVSA